MNASAAARVALGTALALAAVSVISVMSAPSLGAPEPAPRSSSETRRLAPPEAELPEVAEGARALREAEAAAEAGDVDAAAAAFARAAERYPLVSDHALYLRAALLLDQGRLDAAIEAARAAVRQYPHSPLRPRFLRIEGDAFGAAGQEETARAAWALAASLEREDVHEEAVELQLGLSYERTGAVDRAASHYRRVWLEVATVDGAREAGEHLARLEQGTGRSLRSARDWRRHGDALVRRRRMEMALAAYDQALALGLAPGERRNAERQRARCLFRLRRYPEAVEAWAGLMADDPEARVWHARSLARAGDVPAAIEALEEIAREKRNPRALEARYLAALLLDDEDKTRARAHFRSVARSNTEMGQSSRWQLSWSAYLEGRYAEARAGFETLGENETHSISRLRYLYWHARALERSDPQAAAEAYAAMAGEFPLSYYGWRARLRLSPDTPPLAVRPPIYRPGVSRLESRDLARARTLVDGGVKEGAAEELELLTERVGGMADRLRLARMHVAVGNYHDAQVLIVAEYSIWLARGPIDGYEELWWLAWPLAYESEVDSHLAGLEIPQELVYAIMREESGYRPKVVSTAGARGLMQIMPYTGEKLAADTGMRSFDSDDLFSPAVNIRLGSTYLNQLTLRFGGRASAAIGSYNAGPDAVARWLEERPTLDDDEWVESIPYSQTRAYVKRVQRSMQAYRVLY